MGLFRYLLRDARGGILGWSIGLGLLTILVALSFPAIEEAEEFDELWAEYQDSLGSLFGDCPTITDYACYMDTQIVAYLPVLLGIFGVMHAARLLAGAEESGQLDVLLSTPVSRRRLVAHHVLVLAAAQGIVAGVLGVLFFLSALLLGETEHVLPGLLVGINALPASFAFTALAYLVSAIAHRKIAPVIAGNGMVLGSYILGGLAPLSDALDPLKWLSVTHLYQQSQPLRDGLDPAYFLLLLPLSGLLSALAWLRFEGKDLTG